MAVSALYTGNDKEVKGRKACSRADPVQRWCSFSSKIPSSDLHCSASSICLRTTGSTRAAWPRYASREGGREGGVWRKGKILTKLTRFQSLVPIRGFSPASQRAGGQSEGAVAARPHRCQREDERTYNTQNTFSSRAGVGTHDSRASAAFCYVCRLLAAAGAKAASFLSTEQNTVIISLTGPAPVFGLTAI